MISEEGEEYFHVLIGELAN